MSKRLKFILWNGNDLTIDKIVEYDFCDNYYSFIYGGDKFKFRLEDDMFHFIKECENDAFEIFKNGKMRECVYTLKREKVTFVINILELDYKKEDKKCTIKYNIESDMEDDVSKPKTIILDFVHESS